MVSSIRTPKKTTALLVSLSEGLSIAAACRSAGIGRQTYYDWIASDPVFKAMAESAIEDGTDLLEDIAKQRAANDSDTLMIFLLKGRRPDKFRDNQTLRHEGPDGGPLTISMVRIHEPEPS